VHIRLMTSKSGWLRPRPSQNHTASPNKTEEMRIRNLRKVRKRLSHIVGTTFGSAGQIDSQSDAAAPQYSTLALQHCTISALLHCRQVDGCVAGSTTRPQLVGSNSAS
jgi:hypothetical protein